jgi:hypothetical protein
MRTALQSPAVLSGRFGTIIMRIALQTPAVLSRQFGTIMEHR